MKIFGLKLQQIQYERLGKKAVLDLSSITSFKRLKIFIVDYFGHRVSKKFP